MAKRFGKGKGNDTTQDVSLSQFVPPRAPASFTHPPTITRGQKNDMSLWGGVVVGTSDFAPAPTKKTRGKPWKWLAAAAAVIALGVAAFLVLANGDDAPKPAAAVAPRPAVPEPPPAATSGSAASSAHVETVAAEPAPVAAAVTSHVDAVSGAAPIVKPTAVAKKQKKLVRKTIAKKKLAPKKKPAAKKR